MAIWGNRFCRPPADRGFATVSIELPSGSSVDNTRSVAEGGRAALAAANELPAVKGLPSSVRLIQTGDAEIVADLLSGSGMAIVIGVLWVYCVLTLLFKDFLQPMTILSAIPLSLVGLLTSAALSLLVVPVVFTYVGTALRAGLCGW